MYVAFVIDEYARRVLGWRAATAMTVDLVIDALNQTVWQRNRDGHDLTGVIHIDCTEDSHRLDCPGNS